MLQDSYLSSSAYHPGIKYYNVDNKQLCNPGGCGKWMHSEIKKKEEFPFEIFTCFRINKTSW